MRTGRGMRWLAAAALGLFGWGWILGAPAAARAAEPLDALEARAESFLSSHRWRDMNVPRKDGQILRDLVVARRFTRALEVGTSTGHSAIWIALGLHRTGGRLLTLEIDEGRHREALRNLAEAGVADLVEARLGDAHEVVPALPGPFDLVFLDADKDWNVRYFQAVRPKLAPGGCVAVHNVSRSRRGWSGEYLAEVERAGGFVTEIVGSGMALSCREK